jgi:alanine racemase
MGTNCYISVDVQALKKNIEIIKNKTGKTVEVIPVLKANAYGHGLVDMAKKVLDLGCKRIAVSRIEEGVKLREAGVNSEILILYQGIWEPMEDIFRYQVTPCVSNIELLIAIISHLNAQNKKLKVHIAIDTGMGSFGIQENDFIKYQDILWNHPYMEVSGVFTHFVSAYGNSEETFLEQKLRFDRCIALIPKEKRKTITIHAANSPTFLKYQDAYYDAIRIGTILYGLPITGCRLERGIKPISEIKSIVVDVKKNDQSRKFLGYGITSVLQDNTTIAEVNIGYGDLWWLNQGNDVCVLIRGERVSMVGIPYMDRMIVDVTNMKSVGKGDEVVLLGKQGNEEITMEEICKRHHISLMACETVIYAQERVPRIFKD